MKIKFQKYQGTGNDFIIIDNRNKLFDKNPNPKLLKFLCDRKFGIGADGLILFENDTTYSFGARFFNSEGNETGICGNAGGCIAAFAGNNRLIENHLGSINTKFYSAGCTREVLYSTGTAKIKMPDISQVEDGFGYYFIHESEPNYITFVEDINEFDLLRDAEIIKNNHYLRAEDRMQVTFVESSGNKILIRTFDKEVQKEVFPPASSVIAATVANIIQKESFFTETRVFTQGGVYNVIVEDEGETENSFTGIWLIQESRFVFEGIIELPSEKELEEMESNKQHFMD